MKVSVLGVFTGGFADVVPSFLLGIPLAAYALLHTPSTHHALGAVAAETTWARMHAHPLVWTLGIVISLACSAFGGYVAAAIAGHDERLNGTLSSWLCITVGLAFLPLGLNKDPWWLQAFFLLLSPLMAFTGGNIRFHQRLHRLKLAASV